MKIKRIGVREQRRRGIERAKKNLEDFFERLKKLKKGDSIILDDENSENR